MSGLEICTRLRADDATRTLPIIMLSSRGEEALRLRGFSAGADDFVIKPFSMRELMARVHAQLRRNRFAVTNRLLFEAIFNLSTRREGSGAAHERCPSTERDFGYSNVCLKDPEVVFSRKHLLERVWGPSIESPTEQSMST